jgi:protein-serine/threonine kinase
MVRQDKLGFIAQPKATCAYRYYLSLLNPRAHTSQIIPVVTNAADAVNFRNIRESLSLDLENQDLCHSTPSSVPPTPGRRVTGENGQWLGSGTKTPSVAGSPGPVSPPQHEDLFVGFSSVTLHHDGDIS